MVCYRILNSTLDVHVCLTDLSSILLSVILDPGPEPSPVAPPSCACSLSPALPLGGPSPPLRVAHDTPSARCPSNDTDTQQICIKVSQSKLEKKYCCAMSGAYECHIIIARNIPGTHIHVCYVYGIHPPPRMQYFSHRPPSSSGCNLGTVCLSPSVGPFSCPLELHSLCVSGSIIMATKVNT